MTESGLIVVGWREWLALPDLGIPKIKAKIDTGARTSALHVDTLEVEERDGCHWLRFSITATGRKNAPRVECEAPAIARRTVTDSGGHVTLRWFIHARVELGGASIDAEVNLTNRRNMLFPMLLGRSALDHRFTVDPTASYRFGRLRAKKISDAGGCQ